MRLPVAISRVAEIVRQARALVCDIDGTLVDSKSIKWRAFELRFGEFPDGLEEILPYCRGHHHIPRGEKFRYVNERILGLPFTSEIEATYLDEFVFRFNRRKSRHVGMLCFRTAQECSRHPPCPIERSSGTTGRGLMTEVDKPLV